MPRTETRHGKKILSDPISPHDASKHWQPPFDPKPWKSQPRERARRRVADRSENPQLDPKTPPFRGDRRSSGDGSKWPQTPELGEREGGRRYDKRRWKNWGTMAETTMPLVNPTFSMRRILTTQFPAAACFARDSQGRPLLAGGSWLPSRWKHLGGRTILTSFSCFSFMLVFLLCI